MYVGVQESLVYTRVAFRACQPKSGIYAMKVMTSFGYEIMLPRGFWFQTLDVNKPWRQIPADRLLFFFFFFLVFTHFFISDYPKAIRRGEISIKSNHVIERNFEAANSRITVTREVQASYKKSAYVWVTSQNMFCLTHVIMQTHPDNTRYRCHVHPAV